MSDTVDASDTLWVSLAEAGRKQNPPVSRAAVSKRVKKLVEAGRLTTRPGPMGALLVNVVEYLRAVRAETDPAQDLRNGRAEERDGDIGEPPAPASGGDASYHKSRAQREAFAAENARLDLEERLGTILDKDDVEHRTMAVLRRTRDRFLALPATISAKLHAAPDERAVRMILAAELRRVLDALANQLDEAADGEGDEEEDDDELERDQ